MKMLKKLANLLCSSIAFIMVYAFAVAVWVTDRENFMMVFLFFAFCVVLMLVVMSVHSYDYIRFILTVPEVTKCQV